MQTAKSATDIQAAFLAHLSLHEREACIAKRKGDRVAAAAAFNALFEMGENAGLDTNTWAWYQARGAQR